MRKLIWFAIIISAVVFAVYTVLSYAATPLPVVFEVNLVAHDALGRTMHATAQGNNLIYSGGPTVQTSMVTLEYTSDQYLCSGFGG